MALVKHYYKIINYFKNTNYFLNLLLFGAKGLGINKLIHKIICYIFCNNCINYNCCLKCFNCNLIQNNKHPDIFIFNNLNVKINNNYISINEQLRLLENECNINSKLNNKKIFIFRNVHLYNKELITIILGLIKLNLTNNLFFFINYNYENNHLLSLPNYCLNYNIYTPSEKSIYFWYKNNYNNKINNNNIITIIRINNLLPINIIKFVKNKINNKLYNICIKYINLIILKNFSPLILLKLFNKNNLFLDKLLIWITYYLLDLLKFNLNYNIEYIKNYKFKKFIILINKKLKRKKIFLINIYWYKCLLKIKKNILLNNKLFIFIALIKWNYILLKKY